MLAKRANQIANFSRQIRRVDCPVQEMLPAGPLYVQVHIKPDQVPAETVTNEAVEEKMEGSRTKTVGTKD